MLEPIDFSQREGEYLSSDFQQKILAFSILWAIVGFLASAWLFLGQKVGPASLILDRRQAEGRVVDSSSHGSPITRQGSSGSFFQVHPYTRPQGTNDAGARRLVPIKQNGKPKVAVLNKPPQVLVPQPEADATPTPKRHRPAPAAPPRRPDQVARETVDRLLFPVTSSRPARSHLSAVARQVEQSLIRLTNLEGQHHVGLLFDGAGSALVSDAFLTDGSLNRVRVEGRLERAEVKFRDPEYGLAVIALPPGRYGPGIPLAPVPPTRGEELLAFGPSATRCLPVQVRAGTPFGSAAFFVEGSLGEATWGTPLFNDRGELVGCQFASLPSFPGSGVHLAADTAAIYRVMRGYSSSDTMALHRTLNEAYARLTSLAGENSGESEAKRGRILAKIGVSQFYIGMPPGEASRWVNTPSKRTIAAGVENWLCPAPPMELVFVNNRLVAVSTDFTGFSTDTGLSMGARVDRGLLKRNFEKFFLADGLALTPGLDILLDRDGRARQFVVRPEL